MSKWKEKNLGEITSLMVKGITPKYAQIESSNTIRVLNQKCNRKFEISFEESRLHNISLKKVPLEKILKPGDVLINSTGTGTAGRVAQIWSIPVPTTIDGHMILLRPTEEMDLLYYGYAIKACALQIANFAEGSTGQTEINRNRLKNEINIKYPTSLKEQHKIGRLLRTFDEKIKINNKINKNLAA